MNIRLIREWYSLDVNDPTIKVFNSDVQNATPVFKEYYWELGAVTLPFTVEVADDYNITVEYGSTTFRFNSTYSLKTV